MKTSQILFILLAANIILIGLTAARPDNEHFDSVTVREFKLVDAQNKERASIFVESTGEVVFRLRGEDGTIRVKIGAGKDGSGFVFLDGETNPVIHGLANKDGGKLTITDALGKKHEY